MSKRTILFIHEFTGPSHAHEAQAEPIQRVIDQLNEKYLVRTSTRLDEEVGENA